MISNREGFVDFNENVIDSYNCGNEVKLIV